MPMEMERCWYYSGTYCALGVALPMAIGAKIGAPHRPVIAVAGDGGIMFTVNELATAAEERLALPIIVWNNDALEGDRGSDGPAADSAHRRRAEEPGFPAIGGEPRLSCRSRRERRTFGAIRAAMRSSPIGRP